VPESHDLNHTRGLVNGIVEKVSNPREKEPTNYWNGAVLDPLACTWELAEKVER
jgi:hypothetical protein